MGLLDLSFGMPNLDDPKTAAILALGAGLLSGNGKTNRNFGADLSNGLLSGMGAYSAVQKEQMAQQNQERQNRANELQQLMGSYKIAKDLDQQSFMESQLSGAPYRPNPALSQMESRLQTLMGANPMQAGVNPSQPGNPIVPRGNPPAPAPTMVSAPPQNPPMQGGAAAPMPPGAPTGAPAGAPPGPDLPTLLRAANIPTSLAANMIRTGQQAKLFEMIGQALAPKNGPAGVTRIDPASGGLEIMGGNAQPGQVPFARDAQGNLVARPIQGAAEEVARAKGLETQATEGAKAQYQPLTLPMPDGSSVVTTVGRFVGQQQPQGRPPQAASVTVTQPPSPGSGASFGGMSQTPGDRAQQEALAKFHADTFVETQQAGKAAATGLTKLDRIDQLLQGVDTGKLTPTGMNIAAYAQSLGIPIDPKLPNKQAAEALTGQIALELRNPSGGAGMPGALSDNDLKFLRSMTPGLAQTTEGRNMIVETKRKILQRDQDVAKLARDYRAQNRGRIDDGFLQKLQDYSDSHPLFPQQQQAGFRVLGVEK